MSGDDEDWVSSPDAAAALGITTNHVGWLGEHEHLVVQQRAGKRWVKRGSLEALQRERQRWLTLSEAGELLGVSSRTVRRMALRGQLSQRSTDPAHVASIERASVEALLEGREV